MFTTPGVGFSVTIDVVTSAGFTIGQYVFLQTLGTYQVTAKPTAVTLTIYNFGASDDASPGTPILTNTMVNVAGAQGIQGKNNAVVFNFTN